MKYSITTNDGTGHGDHVAAFTVSVPLAPTATEAVQQAYRLLASRGDYDTIVVSANPVPAPQEVTA